MFPLSIARSSVSYSIGTWGRAMTQHHWFLFFNLILNILALDLFMLLRLALSSCQPSCLILPKCWDCRSTPLLCWCSASIALCQMSYISAHFFEVRMNFPNGSFYISLSVVIWHSYVFWLNCLLIDAFYIFFLKWIDFFCLLVTEFFL